MKTERQQDKERVFGFLQRYITISMISILLVISIAFFCIYYNLENARIISNSNSSLLQLSLSCDSLFDSIRRLTFQIYNDSEISKMVNDLDQDATTLHRSYSRLNSYITAGTNIVSIYVYNRQTDCFYTTLSGDPKKSRNDFFDKEAAKLIDDLQNMKILYPISRKIKIYGAPDVPDNTVNIYTILYSYPSFTGYLSKAIIINVSEEWVKNSIESWNKETNGNICIMNEGGTLVSSLYRDQMLQDISQEEFASKILNSKNKAGAFICNVSDVKSFVTYVHSSRLGWYFIRIIPYNSIYDNLKKIGLITVLSLLLYIAIGFVLSYIVAGKAKRSIDDIIDGLKNQIKDNRSGLEKLKEEFLYNSMQGNIPVSQDVINRAFEKYNISMSANNLLVLVMFRIDHYYELCARFKSYDITLLKQAAMKEAYEIFSTKYTIETVDMKDDHIILAFNENGCDEHTSQIDSLIKRVQDTAEKNIQLSLSAVLSPLGYTFMDIDLLYTEVKQASNYRLFLGYKCIIHSEKIKTLNSGEYVYPAGKEKLLLDALMLGRSEPAQRLLDEILESTKSYPCTVMNSLLLRLTSSIVSSFESIESLSKYSVNYDFNSFITTLNRCETIEEIRNRYFDMFIHVFSALEKQKNSKRGVLVNNAIKIINQEYTVESLCLNTIADKLGLSPNYLGRLFKTYTSRSVGDYINKVRVEKTLKLLEECNIPVNDIAVKVGFCSKSYFYTIFKKVVGATPSEYRQKIKDKNNL